MSYGYTAADDGRGRWKILEHRPEGDRVVRRGRGRLGLAWWLAWNRHLRPRLVAEERP